MGFKKGDGSSFTLVGDASTTDTILLCQGNEVNEATLQTMGDTLGFFSQVSASALIDDIIEDKELITQASASAIIADQIAAGDFVTSSEVSAQVSGQVAAQIGAGDFVTSSQVSAQVSIQVADQLGTLDFITTAEVCGIVEGYGFLVSAITTAQTCGIVENYGFITEISADSKYLTEALTTAQTCGIVENYGFITEVSADSKYLTEALTTAQGDDRYIVSTSAVSAGTYGSSTVVPQITVGTDGRVTEIVLTTAPPVGGAQNLFSTFSASSGSVGATDPNSTLDIRGDGTNITTSITGSALTIQFVPGEFRTSAEISAQIDSFGFLTESLTTAQADARYTTTAETCGIVEGYGFLTEALTTAQADDRYLTTSEGDTRYTTTAEVCTLVESYGFLTEAITTAEVCGIVEQPKPASFSTFITTPETQEYPIFLLTPAPGFSLTNVVTQTSAGSLEFAIKRAGVSAEVSVLANSTLNNTAVSVVASSDNSLILEVTTNTSAKDLFVQLTGVTL